MVEKDLRSARQLELTSAHPDRAKRLWAHVGCDCVVMMIMAASCPIPLVCQALELGPFVASVGKLDGAEEEAFGWIFDLALGPEGGMVIADVELPGVVWFDNERNYRGGVLGNGSGPGEIRTPRSIAVDRDGDLHVLDPGNLRVSTFTLVDTGVKYSNDFRLNLPAPQSMCYLNGKFYVLALGQRELVNVFGPEGAELAAFGAPEHPNAKGRLVSAAGSLWTKFNSGVLECDAATGRILVAHTTIGLLRAFSADGVELWRTVLPDYAMPNWGTDGEGRISAVSSRTDRVHEIAHIASDGSWIFVTLWKGGVGDVQGSTEVRVVRLADGVQVSRIETDDRLADVRDGLALFHKRYPFPVVTVRPYRVR